MPTLTPDQIKIQILQLRVANLTATLHSLLTILVIPGQPLPITDDQKAALTALMTDNVPTVIDNN